MAGGNYQPQFVRDWWGFTRSDAWVKVLEKSNNALYVVDGVPMLSLTSKQGEGRFQSAGSTESIADINPDDIESMTVLTGLQQQPSTDRQQLMARYSLPLKKGKKGR